MPAPVLRKTPGPLVTAGQSRDASGSDILGGPNVELTETPTNSSKCSFNLIRNAVEAPWIQRGRPGPDGGPPAPQRTRCHAELENNGSGTVLPSKITAPALSPTIYLRLLHHKGLRHRRGLVLSRQIAEAHSGLVESRTTPVTGLRRNHSPPRRSRSLRVAQPDTAESAVLCFGVCQHGCPADGSSMQHQ